MIYPSGHTDKLDVAVRRSVLTGVGQTCRQLSEINALDMGCDLMEITAHSGARPSHAEWQGQIVSLSGRKGYLSKADIGYGTGDGFGGWNCRHDWYPFFEGISKRAYTDENLRALNEKNIEYDGKKYSEYEISQSQRKMERDIRQLKREAIAADTGIKNADSEELSKQFAEDFTKTSVKLKEKERKLKDFLNETGQLPDSSRVWANGFDKSISQKAVWANKKSPISLTKFLKESNINDRDKQFKEYLKLGRINTTIESSQQQKHQLTPSWKNQVKQAMNSNGKLSPKSRLDKNIDPQKFVDKYSGTGNLDFPKSGNCVHEYITFPQEIGVTFDKKTGKYVRTNVIQIKYTSNGVHIFPTIGKEEK